MADPFLLKSRNIEGFYIRHHNFEAELMRLPGPGKELEDFLWFEQVDGRDPVDGVVRVRFRAFQHFKGKSHFLRHQNFRVVLQPNDGTAQFAQDSLFRRLGGLKDAKDGWESFEASNPDLKDHWIRHHSFHLFVNRRTVTDLNFVGDASFHKEDPSNGKPID